MSECRREDVRVTHEVVDLLRARAEESEDANISDGIEFVRANN